MGFSRIALLAAAACCAGLAGCGGGGDDEPAIEVLPDRRVLAGSEDIRPGDYVGRTFPLIFTAAEDAVPQAATGTGRGTVEVVDADTIVITLPGATPIAFDRISATEFSDGFGEVLTFEDFGAAQYFYLSGGAPGVELLAAYGFETPVTARPVTARYGDISASVAFFVPDGSSGWIGVGGGGTLDLIARFNGSGGTIQGTLLDGTELIDFTGDGTADDLFALRTTLDGTITSSGFGGTVDGTASVTVAGTGVPQDLALTIGNSSVDGKFFGTNADVVSGSYGGTASVTSPGGPTEPGRLTGFFVADR